MPKKKKQKKIKVKKTKIKARKKRIVKLERMYKCMRCKKEFVSIRGLKRHSAEHLRDLREMKMLREGYVPEETKLGFGFKGKNKVIIS